jgi:glyoxylase-like metal-dependent hydrolase (beta-lactamase superfamily II)
MTDYEQPRPVTPLAAVVLAANPGPMTLDGTNTWVLRSDPGRPAIVVDPGPLDEAHLTAVAALGPISAILLTHRHLDHSAGARRLHELTGADVRALDPEQRIGSEGLGEGDVVAGDGLELRVWATPGHTADSLSFVLAGAGAQPAVLTGDTILGRGTAVVAEPDGDLGDYLTSLHRLAELGAMTVLPGHGPELVSAGEVAQAYLAHRAQRLDQVRSAIERLDLDHNDSGIARQIVEDVYADVNPVLWPAAEQSVRAQLAYLRRDYRAR